jgi:ribosomal-protein-alanine N-acetyltransferase
MTQALIRPWIRRDMPEVEAIEEANHQWSAQTPEQLLRMFCDRNTICQVAEVEGRVVGFMAYELMPKRIHLLCLELHPDWQGQGIAWQFLYKLQQKLSERKRRKITVSVRETDLAAQKFLRYVGFLATKVIREVYEDTKEDAFFFEFNFTQLPEAQEVTENLVLDE